MIKHLKLKFPDICKQVLVMDKIYSKNEIEKKVIEFSKLFGVKPVRYEATGNKVEIYTSRKFTDKLEFMKKGDSLLDRNTGKIGVITSEEPFFCGCSLCFRVDFGESSDVYDCSYFM